MRKAHFAVLSSVVVAGAIATPVASALSTPTAPRAVFSTCRPTGTLVCLTRNASNHTTTVHKGEIVELTLSGSDLSWTKPQVTDKRHLRLIGAAIQRGGESRGSFSAIQIGHATIQATATAKCSPGQICPQFALVWRATIVITS